jgi:hypothetical protein
MRAWFIAGAVVLSVLCCSGLGQQVGSGAYVPPQLTLERLMQDDPTFSGIGLWTLAADPAEFRATVEKHAAAGKLVAQMLLGEAYIPRECTDLPLKTAPADCPDDVGQDNLLGLTRSFDSAVHWLTLASKQGSGEASEVLAQVMERAIKSGQSGYTMADVAHFHAVARSQGFDLQDAWYSCYRLDTRGPTDRLVMADTQPEYQFTSQELAALHSSGASGTIRWGGTSEAGTSTLMRHPEGPKVRIRVIVSRPVGHEVLVPIGDRVDVIYLQQGDRVVTMPATYPALRRTVAFRPGTAEQAGGAVFQSLDGTFTGGCESIIFP